jgi:hypothetical protein
MSLYFEQFVPEVERLVREHGKLRLLFDMTGFQGWEVSAGWEDFKFGVEHFADMERLAMVGETRWQHGMARNGDVLQAVHNSDGPLLRLRRRCRSSEVVERSIVAPV